jgi:glyoxylase-like metal-dependent hydrolase (beta-lactamase superfamily II)
MKTHRFRLGRFDCTVIVDGVYEHGTSEFLFSDTPRESLDTKLQEYGSPGDPIPIPIHCLIVRTDENTVLIDTGLGAIASKMKPPTDAGNCLDLLESIGIRPPDIDTVLLSHLHLDHIGGISTPRGKPLFPNARYLMSKKEWETALSLDHWCREKLLTIKECITLFEPFEEILPGIKGLPAAGHTPGHTIFTIRYGHEELVYIADVLAHPLHVEMPEWTMNHESNKKRAVSNRKKILERACKTGVLIHACHMPFPGLGRIVRNKRMWRWQPIASSSGKPDSA